MSLGRLHNFSKFTQVVNGRTRFQTWVIFIALELLFFEKVAFGLKQ